MIVLVLDIPTKIHCENSILKPTQKVGFFVFGVQTYIVGENIYHFWLCAEMTYAETTRIANNYLAQKHSYLS
ncbi:hypothetical protein DX910_11045 [Acinetobacter haemolyticus]|nr:hypothetical protein DX910_11045 [Acinetobacter haemolyticus]